jgi:hypothetical protein
MAKLKWVADERKQRLVDTDTGKVVGDIVLVAVHTYGAKLREPVEWWQAYQNGYLGEYMGLDAARKAVVRSYTQPGEPKRWW